MAKEANYFYEAERKNIVVSHEDFAVIQEMDEMSEIESIEEFLLSRLDWESNLTNNRPSSSSSTKVDTRLANEIFTECLAKCANRVDSVQLFDVITKFYNFNPQEYYVRLGHGYRTKLVNDLKIRIGKIKQTTDTMVDSSKMQKSFEDLLSRFAS